MKEIIPKRVSNYELFYDLVFALAMSRLTAFLHTEQFVLTDLVSFIGSTFLVMSIWIYQTVYLNKYGERDPLDVYMNIPAMFIMGNFALLLGKHEYNETEYLMYNTLLIASYAIILLQYYLRGRRSEMTDDIKGSMRLLAITIGYFIILTVSGWILKVYQGSNQILYWLWNIPIVFPFIFNKSITHERINFPHLVERCQLITIITFGETVLGVIRTYPFFEEPLNSVVLFSGVCFMFMAYISQTALTLNHEQTVAGTALLYAHIFIIIGMNLVTVAIELLLDEHHRHYGVELLLVGIIIYYFSLYSTSVYNKVAYQFGRLYYLKFAGIVLAGSILIWLFHESLPAIEIIFALIAYLIPRLHYLDRRKVQQ